MPLLDDVIAAHGGREQWAGVRQVRVDLQIGGNLFATKFKSTRVRRLTCTIDTRRVHIVLEPFPRSGQRGIFNGRGVEIQTDIGEIVVSRTIVRDAEGRVPDRMFWTDLDVLYFFGYALWNYTVTPYVFMWPGFECHEGPPWTHSDGSRWRTLDVRYPAGFPTHCRDQRFYFDDRGLLRRLDYTADVFGPRARGAHFCEEHRTFDGVVFPTHRIVYPRRASGLPVRWISVMEGWISTVALRRDADPPAPQIQHP